MPRMNWIRLIIGGFDRHDHLVLNRRVLSRASCRGRLDSGLYRARSSPANGHARLTFCTLRSLSWAADSWRCRSTCCCGVLQARSGGRGAGGHRYVARFLSDRPGAIHSARVLFACACGSRSVRFTWSPRSSRQSRARRFTKRVSDQLSWSRSSRSRAIVPASLSTASVL